MILVRFIKEGLKESCDVLGLRFILVYEIYDGVRFIVVR